MNTIISPAERRRLRSQGLGITSANPTRWLAKVVPMLPRRWAADIVDAILSALTPRGRRSRTIEGAEAIRHLAGGHVVCPGCGSSCVFLVGAKTLLGSDSRITVAGTIATDESKVEGDALLAEFNCEGCPCEFGIRLQHVDDETAITIDILEDGRDAQ